VQEGYSAFLPRHPSRGAPRAGPASPMGFPRLGSGGLKPPAWERGRPRCAPMRPPA
jgi:hypothetical protein